jgi:hypothetical protein
MYDLEEDEITTPGILVGETMVPLASVQEIAADAILILDEEEEPFVFVEESQSRFSITAVSSPESGVRPTYEQLYRRLFHGEE